MILDFFKKKTLIKKIFLRIRIIRNFKYHNPVVFLCKKINHLISYFFFFIFLFCYSFLTNFFFINIFVLNNNAIYIQWFWHGSGLFFFHTHSMIKWGIKSAWKLLCSIFFSFFLFASVHLYGICRGKRIRKYSGKFYTEGIWETRRLLHSNRVYKVKGKTKGVEEKSQRSMRRKANEIFHSFL